MIDEGPSPEDIERFNRETVRCPECGAEMYDDLPQCPRCRAWLDDRGRSGVKRWQQWAIAIVAALVLLGLLLRAAF